jgi:hypothetical protein
VARIKDFEPMKNLRMLIIEETKNEIGKNNNENSNE